MADSAITWLLTRTPCGLVSFWGTDVPNANPKKRYKLAKQFRSEDEYGFLVRRAYILRDRGMSRPEIAKKLGKSNNWVDRLFQQPKKS